MAVRIKICGITRLEDAVAARDAGADYLGFIQYTGSPRFIAPKKVSEIVRALKSDGNCPILVGVFVDTPPEAAASTLDYCDLDLAQLSGDESPDMLVDSRSPLFGRSYKGIQPRSKAEALQEAARYQPPAPHSQQPILLIDAYHELLRGGTGRTADWSMAEAVCKEYPGLMLAGGLNPDNVLAAISLVQPFAVDVSSGVEDNPGIKSTSKVQAFFRSVQEA